MSKLLDEVNETNWLKSLAIDYLKKEKWRKRRGQVYKGIIAILLIGLLIFMILGGKETDRTHVGVIDIDGEISATTNASADKVIKSIHNAYQQKGLQALLLRVNSPGGSPVQADYIYDELVYYRKLFPKIKVYTICSDMCASAAYYIASASDDIFAAPSSLVGSIGVIYSSFGFSDAIQKIGVARRLITSGKNKGFLDPFSPMTDNDKTKLKAMLDIIHLQFEDKVKRGRGQRLKISDETFTGLFWTGEQALKMGLIDGLSNQWQLIRAKKLSHQLINYTSSGSVIERLSQMLSSEVIGQGVLNQVRYPRLG